MDQALVDAALGDLGCPVWVNQLAGYHHAAAPVQRPGEGVHVEADQRAVGTERLAGGDADVGAELGGQQVEAGVLWISTQYRVRGMVMFEDPARVLGDT